MVRNFMGQLTATREYRCDNDCERSGCPGHTATLKFNSIANIYQFDDGNGQTLLLDLSLAEAMIDMFRHYSETRADTVKV